MNEKIQHPITLSCDANKEKHFEAFHASALCGYPRYPTALNSTSKRVRVHARVNNIPAPDVTIDTASDVPCISIQYVQNHPTLKTTEMFGVPQGAINLSSADGSPLKILGYVRFQLTLGDITLPVDALVLPSLGPDIMLLDNTIMGAFGAILDWSNEQLSFKNSKVKIKASHRIANVTKHSESSEMSQCSVVTIDPRVESVPVFLKNKCTIPPQSEMAVHVVSARAPIEDTAALIQPLIVTYDEIASSQAPDAFEHLVVARTVCNWSAADKIAVIQIANPSHQYVYLKQNTVLGQIAPISDVPNKTVSAVQTDCKIIESTRHELRAALSNAFDQTTFSTGECEQVLDLCTKYRSVFSLSPRELGKCTLGEAEFPLEPGTRPVDRAPYRANPRVQETIDKCVNQMEKDGIIEQRPSPWGSAVTIVAKKDGTPRFCVDYRSTINKSLIKKSWPMPQVQAHLDTVGGARYITVCDVQNAYHQIPIAASEQDKTAFVTQNGKWVFKRLPFGIANAPFLFSRIMSLAFAHFGPKSGLLVYMDDCICCSATWDSHIQLLENMFKALQAAGLTLKPSKVQFGPKEVKYLGHILTADGIRIGTDRIKAIVDLPTPKNIKELRSVLGMVNFVRKFIPNLAGILAPLVALTKKEAVKEIAKRWNSEHDQAYAKVKQLLTEAPVLQFPDFSKDFVIHVDASEAGAGAFLGQQKGDDLVIIAFFSHRFNESQRHYSATLKECYAVVLAIQHWRPYLWGRHFVCVTDHAALRYLYSMQDTSNMLTRWAIALQSFDFTVQHKPGKLHVVPDTLSRMFAFEHQQEIAEPTLAPICRNVPDNPRLHTALPPRPYQISADKLNDLEPVRSDRELFNIKSVFVSATNVFMSVDQNKLRTAQAGEYGRYIEYITQTDAPLPEKETRTTMSYYSVQDGVLFKSYLPGHLRKRSTFRDQLVVPKALVSLILHAYHDHVLSGGHLAFRPTYDKIRQKYWWPTVSRDVREWCEKCQACQRRKTSHNRPKLPTGHLPVERPFQRISVDLVEYKSVSISAAGTKCKYVLSMMDHLTRFAVLLPVRNKAAETVAQAIIERIISIFGPPETLHSDQGPEFENKIIYQMQQILGYKKTRTTPYRPQGNSVSERVHSTMHNMLAMHSAIDQSNWASLLPFVQLAHNTSFSATMHETPFFLMFGRQPRLPVDIILGIPHVGNTADTEEFAQHTRDNLQTAFELARRNLTERADKQAENNSKLKPYPVFQPGQEILVYRPYQDSDGPNPKLLLPWRGPYIVCSQLSPVVYRVRLKNDTREVSVHLAHIKPYQRRETPPAPQFEKLAELFLGKPIPLPDLDHPDEAQPKIESYFVDRVVNHKCGPGRKSSHNFKYRLRLRGYGPESDLEYRADEIPQCHEMIAAYRTQKGLQIAMPPPPAPPPPPSGKRKRKVGAG